MGQEETFPYWFFKKYEELTKEDFLNIIEYVKNTVVYYVDQVGMTEDDDIKFGMTAIERLVKEIMK